MEKITVKTTKEHFDKYDNLVKEKGFDYLLPLSKEEIINALNEGDIHLNSICKLASWDRYASQIGYTRKDENGKKYQSLCEQVCFLKHIAIFHIAEAQPDFTK